jgi:hypothetical protein
LQRHWSNFHGGIGLVAAMSTGIGSKRRIVYLENPKGRLLRSAKKALANVKPFQNACHIPNSCTLPGQDNALHAQVCSIILQLTGVQQI